MWKKGAVGTKRPMGHPVKEIRKNRLQEINDLWEVAGKPCGKRGHGKR
jgi:hypothetical protein